MTEKKEFYHWIEEAINDYPLPDLKCVLVIWILGEDRPRYIEPKFKKCTLPEEEQG